MKPRFRFNIQVKYPPRTEQPGDWGGTQKGTGYELWGLRKYETGDSYRHIDWKAKARSGQLYVREFSRDSAYNLVLLCDISASMHLGRKMDLMRDVAASLAFAAIQDNNPCGLILFADGVCQFVPPSAAPKHLLRIVHALQKAPREKPGKTSLQPALQLMKQRTASCIGVILSDFDFDLDEIRGDLESASSRRVPSHELVALHILEKIERTHSDIRDGEFWTRDMESGQKRLIDMAQWRRFDETLATDRTETVLKLARSGINSALLTVGDRDIQRKVNTLFARRIAARV